MVASQQIRKWAYWRIDFPELYWISTEKASGLPAVSVNGNDVARANFDGVRLGGRVRGGKFVTSLDNQKYISESFEVRFIALASLN